MVIEAYIQKGAELWGASSTFNIDRRNYLNASTATQCIRHQWYSRRDPEQEPFNGYMARGRVGEEYIVRCLVLSGAILKYCGEDQMSIVHEDYGISATPDGYMLYEGKWVLLEFKTMDPRTRKHNLPRDSHKMQVRIGMELAHAQTIPEYPKPEYAILVYLNASDFSDITAFHLQRDPKVLADMADRARVLLQTNDVDSLDREGKRNNTCASYGGCKYAQVCGVTLSSNSVPEAVSTSHLGITDGIAEEYYQCKQSIDRLTSQLASYKEDLVQKLHKDGVYQITTRNYKLSLVEVPGKITYDIRAMEKDGVPLDLYKRSGAPYNRLTLTPLTSS